MALIEVFDRTGRRVAACDARCYDAQGPDCNDCICGGVCHGAGLELARESMRRTTPARFAELLDAWARNHGRPRAALTMAVQLDAFPFGNEPVKRPRRRRQARAS